MKKDPAGRHVPVDSQEGCSIQGLSFIAIHIKCLKCVYFATEIRVW
jgi:hypothetical protein